MGVKISIRWMKIVAMKEARGQALHLAFAYFPLNLEHPRPRPSKSVILGLDLYELSFQALISYVTARENGRQNIYSMDEDSRYE